MALNELYSEWGGHEPPRSEAPDQSMQIFGWPDFSSSYDNKWEDRRLFDNWVEKDPDFAAKQYGKGQFYWLAEGPLPSRTYELGGENNG